MPPILVNTNEAGKCQSHSRGLHGFGILFDDQDDIIMSAVEVSSSTVTFGSPSPTQFLQMYLSSLPDHSLGSLSIASIEGLPLAEALDAVRLRIKLMLAFRTLWCISFLVASISRAFSRACSRDGGDSSFRRRSTTVARSCICIPSLNAISVRDLHLMESLRVGVKEGNY